MAWSLPVRPSSVLGALKGQLTDVEAPRLAGVFSAVAAWAAVRSYRRLSLTTMPESRVGRAAARAGFIQRPDPYPLMILTTNPDAVIPSADTWWLTPFVLNTW